MITDNDFGLNRVTSKKLSGLYTKCLNLAIFAPLLTQRRLIAQVVKLVDTLSSGGSSARCAGSSPVLGTSVKLRKAHFLRVELFI